MNPIYSISLNKIAFINSWKNGVFFLILLVFISYNTKAQSFQMVGKVTGILTLNPSGLTLENKAFSTNKNPDKETNYKIIAAPSKVEDCPNKDKLHDLCESIALKKLEKEKKNLYYYEYERKILEASCVDPLNDSEKEISRKVNLLWDKYQDHLVCTSANFEVNKGSILKLAISTRLYSVIEDAVLVWKVNLNRVDPYDNSTILDYVGKVRDSQNDSSNRRELQRYYELLLEGGAKHRSEL